MIKFFTNDAKHESANPAKPVDSDFRSHEILPLAVTRAQSAYSAPSIERIKHK
jgi:hypothetical protein